MSFNSNIAEKWVLVIEDKEGMRAQLRMSLSSAGFAKLHIVSGIKDALDRMATNHYDVILCDYALGDGTDGQQFLEYLRINDLINRNTIFFIITAEQSYEKVVSIAECAPDDYLLKPFTAAQFNARLEKLLERQEYFAVIDKATDTKDWGRTIIECDKKIALKDKYYFDLCKIKSSALIRAHRAHDASELYKDVLAIRPVGWAKLGLARALAMLDKKNDAKLLAQNILKESPRFMATYDFLGKMLETSGDKNAALDVLEKARAVSPGTMSRNRELSTLAVSAGKPALAETVMRQALQKHKHSPVRQANDYAVLSKALVNQGKVTEALEVVAEAQKNFKDGNSEIILAASESIAHRSAGHNELAEAALIKALDKAEMSNLPVQTLISLADACFGAGKEEEAGKFLRHAIQNNHEDEEIKYKVHDLLISAGKEDEEASAIIETSTKEVIHLNNEGVVKAEAGQFVEAISLLCQAADRLPNNLQIVSNASLVIALDLVRNGNNFEKLGKCLHYRDCLIKKSPNHPKLAHIDKLLKQLKS